MAAEQFTVYVDDKPIASPYSQSSDFAMLSGSLSKSANCADSLTFCVPRQNPITFSDVGKKVIMYFSGGEGESWPPFSGYVNKVTQDAYGNKTVECFGGLGFLNLTTVHDISAHTTPLAYMTTIVNAHNHAVQYGSNPEREMQINSVTYSGTCALGDYKDWVTSYDALVSNMTDAIGGYLFIGGNDPGLIYSQTLPDQGNIGILTVGNLTNLEAVTDLTMFCSDYVPLGATQSDGSRLTIASVNSGIDHLFDQTLIDTYGFIRIMETFDDITDATKLLAQGRVRFNELKKINKKITIEAFDQDLLDKIEIYTKVSVRLDQYNISGEATITEFTLDLCDPAASKIVVNMEV